MTDEIKIDKNIPLPPRAGRTSELTKAMKQLEIGDSFLSPDKRLTPNLHMYARSANIKIAIRKQPDGGHRIWRIQ